MVVVCCFVVSTKCANRFSIYCIDSLFNCSGSFRPGLTGPDAAGFPYLVI